MKLCRWKGSGCKWRLSYKAQGTKYWKANATFPPIWGFWNSLQTHTYVRAHTQGIKAEGRSGEEGDKRWGKEGGGTWGIGWGAHGKRTQCAGVSTVTSKLFLQLPLLFITIANCLPTRKPFERNFLILCCFEIFRNQTTCCVHVL